MGKIDNPDKRDGKSINYAVIAEIKDPAPVPVDYGDSISRCHGSELPGYLGESVMVGLPSESDGFMEMIHKTSNTKEGTKEFDIYFCKLKGLCKNMECGYNSKYKTERPCVIENSSLIPNEDNEMKV